MAKKVIRSKRRRQGSVFDIDNFALEYEINDLIKNPYKKYPSQCEILTLQEWGFTIEDFRKNINKFRAAYEKAWGEPVQWQ